MIAGSSHILCLPKERVVGLRVASLFERKLWRLSHHILQLDGPDQFCGSGLAESGRHALLSAYASCTWLSPWAQVLRLRASSCDQDAWIQSWCRSASRSLILTQIRKVAFWNRWLWCLLQYQELWKGAQPLSDRNSRAGRSWALQRWLLSFTCSSSAA